MGDPKLMQGPCARACTDSLMYRYSDAIMLPSPNTLVPLS